MKYIIIDPLANSSGIGSYTKSLSFLLKEKGIDFEVMDNQKKLPPSLFRKEVYKYITENYGYNEVIIEAPEAKAATLLIPKQYNVHIRLHCPLAIAQKYDSKEVNEVEYSNELRVINKAKIVSSPSYGLLDELSGEILTNSVFVYKNPITSRVNKYTHPKKREYDIVFMGRMQYLKGSDYIRKIIEMLPEKYNVLVFGNNSEKLKLGTNYKCNVDVRMQIESDMKFDLISNSKVLMQLSRFENCSMVILEALSVGTPVVCWNVGGNSEISNNGTIIPVTNGDINELVNNVDHLINCPLLVNKFEESLSLINKDFYFGLKSVIDAINNKDKIKTYKGINNNVEALSHVIRTKKINSAGAYMPKRIFGIAYSNEHAEQLWAPFINALGADYRYVSRKNMGYHKIFDEVTSTPSIDSRYFCVFDWILYPERLIRQIINYKPNLILFHNGSHPSYSHIIPELKKLGIPIVYSELGWFPQKNNVYFDPIGVNGQSLLSKMTYEELTKCSVVKDEKKLTVQGDYHLVATQLDNDTNLIVNSHRFKSKDSFLRYVVNSIDKNEIIYIKLHPKDKGSVDNDILLRKNVFLVDDDISVLLSNAKSVISINSTVLIQALEYNCNIYYCGDSIIDNKGVAEKFDRVELKSIISDNLFCGKKIKQTLADSLKKYQVNIHEIGNMSSEDIIQRLGMRPFFNLDLMDFSTLIDIDNTSAIEKFLSGKKDNKITKLNIKSKSKNKLVVDLAKRFVPKKIRKIVPYSIRATFFE